MAQYCGIDPMWVGEVLIELMRERLNCQESADMFVSVGGLKEQKGVSVESFHGEKND